MLTSHASSSFRMKKRFYATKQCLYVFIDDRRPRYYRHDYLLRMTVPDSVRVCRHPSALAHRPETHPCFRLAPTRKGHRPPLMGTDTVLMAYWYMELDSKTEILATMWSSSESPDEFRLYRIRRTRYPGQKEEDGNPWDLATSAKLAQGRRA